MCINDQVILLRTLSQADGLVNGARGLVVGFRAGAMVSWAKRRGGGGDGSGGWDREIKKGGRGNDEVKLIMWVVFFIAT